MALIFTPRFELHVSETGKEHNLDTVRSELPEASAALLIGHGLLKPPEFALMLRQFAFVLGTGDPRDSPTPLLGLSQGAAFINPRVVNVDMPALRSQHAGLESVQPPHVCKHLDTPVTRISYSSHRH